jgi:transmembrane sensor
MQDNRNYTEFTVVDFMNDAYFQEGVKHPDGETAMFWRNWMVNNPERRVFAEKARAVLERLGFIEHRPDRQQALDSLGRVWAMIGEQEGRGEADSAGDTDSARIRWLPPLAVIALKWKWAAVLVLALGAGVGLWIGRGHRTVTESTAYAVTRTLYLADSSVVILNGHSSISFKKENPREVWLTGEAYFKVRPVLRGSAAGRPYMPFSVHTPKLTVEVLGTAFDVRERRGRTQVVLDEGKVRVSFDRSSYPGSGGKYADILLEPGERVVLDDSARSVEQSASTPVDFTGWREGKLVLTDAALSDIITYVEDNYGKQIILSDPSMEGKQIRGELLLDNLDDILFVLSKVLNVRVEKHAGDTIILRHM